VVADPRHRQIRENFLVLAEPLELGGVARGHDQIPMGQHRALRNAGRSRRVADDGDVVRAALRHLGVEVCGVADLELPPELAELGQAHQAGLAVGAHSARVVVNDVRQARAARPDAQELVHLLLVLDDGEPRLGMIDDVLRLFLAGVLVDRDRNAAQRLRRHDRPVELGPVVPHDGDSIAAREAERCETVGDQAGLVEVARPGVRLPDPEVLLTDRDLAADPSRVLPHELRKRVALGVECLQPASVRVGVSASREGRAEGAGLPLALRARLQVARV
jgi:hypothetical protein